MRKPRCEVTNRMCESYRWGRCFAKGICSYKEQIDTEVEMAETSIKKKDIAYHAAETAGITQKAATAFLDEALAFIGAALSRGKEINLVGFGKFRVKATKARTARNPQTGETIQVPAKKKVVFRPAKDLKEVVG